jgi:hypothetical protein
VLGTALVAVGGTAWRTDETWGRTFAGYTLRVKLIGGTQYEKLYTRIPEWEAADRRQGRDRVLEEPFRARP